MQCYSSAQLWKKRTLVWSGLSTETESYMYKRAKCYYPHYQYSELCSVIQPSLAEAVEKSLDVENSSTLKESRVLYYLGSALRAHKKAKSTVRCASGEMGLTLDSTNILPQQKILAFSFQINRSFLRDTSVK